MLEKLGITSSKGLFRNLAIALFIAALKLPAIEPYADTMINVASILGVTGISKALIVGAKS